MAAVPLVPPRATISSIAGLNAKLDALVNSPEPARRLRHTLADRRRCGLPLDHASWTDAVEHAVAVIPDRAERVAWREAFRQTILEWSHAYQREQAGVPIPDVGEAVERW